MYQITLKIKYRNYYLIKSIGNLSLLVYSFSATVDLNQTIDRDCFDFLGKAISLDLKEPQKHQFLWESSPVWK